MSKIAELHSILIALDIKRNELARPELSSAKAKVIEMEIRNLRYCLEDVIRAYLKSDNFTRE